MNQVRSKKSISALAYLSLLPLIFALFLALYKVLDLAKITGHTIHFARLNSYIYAHSYGALLLALYAGIQIGLTLENHHRWYGWFNFALLGLAWFSYHSFADVMGFILLICCWLAALLIDLSAEHQNTTPRWYAKLKLKINCLVILTLLALVLLNR